MLYKEYEDWLIKFIVKHQPIDSEDVNRLIQMAACVRYYDIHTKKLYDIDGDVYEPIETIDKYQKEIFKRIEPFLIITGRN